MNLDPSDSSALRRSPRVSLSFWKKLAFSIFTVGLMFALAEFLLWVAGVRPLAVEEDPFVGFAGNLPLYVSTSHADGVQVMVTAENKQQLFNRQQFLLPKPPGTFRIFCLGGSTTYGHPYDDRASFAEGLRKLLPCADASRNWEVINAGGISYASYRVVTLMKELIGYEPDLFIVYTGHNEFLEQRTYEHFLTLPPLVRQTSTALSHARVYSVMRELLIKDADKGRQRELLAAEVDARLDHSVGPADYHRDETLRRQIVEHFRINLRRMVRIAEEAGAEVLFVTPASNLKNCSPFKSEHRHGLSDVELSQWSSAFLAGRRRQQNRDWMSAIEQYRIAASIDGRYAELHYRIGECLLELDQPQAAEEALARARDEDVCPLRAPQEVIDAVRSVALTEKAACVDFQAFVAEQSRNRFGLGSPGNELFLDHVHLSLNATTTLAELIVDELVRRKFVRHAVGERCRTEASRQMNAHISAAEQAVGLRNIAKVYSWAGKLDEAGIAALAALELSPNDRECLFIAGAYQKRLGRWDEAAYYYRRALEMEIADQPQDVEARRFLAETLLEQEELNKARQQFEFALRLQPLDIDANLGLAKVLIRLGELAAARRHVQQALEVDADHPEAQELMDLLASGQTRLPTMPP